MPPANGESMTYCVGILLDEGLVLAADTRTAARVDHVASFQIYEAGNFIEATPETPFLQIGETKYGKPILDRVVRHDMTLAEAAKAALNSFDSTMRSNIPVGPPIDLMIYRRDTPDGGTRIEVADEDAYFSGMRRAFGDGTAALFDAIEAPPVP